MQKTYDVIIIGKGPAGISAAIYTKRAGLSTAIIANGFGSLEKAENVSNYYGIESISGIELAKIGIKQAENFNIDMYDAEVVGIEGFENFNVETSIGEFTSKTVLLACGQSRVKLKAQNLDRFEGKGICYCAVCDGFLYRKKKLAVIGSGEYASKEAASLLNFSDNITIITNGDEYVGKNLTGVKKDNRKIAQFDGDDRLRSIIFDDGTKEEYDGVFIAVGVAGAVDFAKKIGVLLEGIAVKVDKDFMTNVKGLFAAGDCIGGFSQVSKSVGEGALAARSIISYIKASKGV